MLDEPLDPHLWGAAALPIVLVLLLCAYAYDRVVKWLRGD